jgi:CRP/FNR family transcriptional regulator, dissimilatory nitrate respiration regulator
MALTLNIPGFLEHAEFFAGLDPVFRRQVAEICTPRQVKKGECLFREGDAGDSVYFLVSGNVELTKAASNGRNVAIRVMKDGEIFGEVVLFERSEYPVTATAVRKSLLLRLPRREFFVFMENEKFRNDFISGMLKKMRYLAERIKYLSLHDVEDRFRIFLAEHYGKKPVIRPALSKKDIASAVGATPETFSRLIGRLAAERSISWEHGVLKIKEEFWKAGAAGTNAG